MILVKKRKSLCGPVTKLLDSGLKVSEFEFQLHYRVHFRTKTPGKGTGNPLMNPALDFLMAWETGVRSQVESSWWANSKVTRRLPFPKLPHRGVGKGATPFPRLLHFILDLYLIMLSVKQGGIKDHFSSFWYDSSWDWTRSLLIQNSNSIKGHKSYNLYI